MLGHDVVTGHGLCIMEDYTVSEFYCGYHVKFVRHGFGFATGLDGLTYTGYWHKG